MDLLQRLLDEAEAHSSGRFTLDVRRARQKLAHFRLTTLEEVCLGFMRAILQAGAREVRFHQNARELRFDFDGPGFSALEELTLLELTLLEGERAYTWLAAAILSCMAMFGGPVTVRAGGRQHVYDRTVERPLIGPASPGNQLLVPLRWNVRRWLAGWLGRSREFVRLSRAFCHIEVPIYLNGLRLRAKSLPAGDSVLHLDASGGKELKLRTNPPAAHTVAVAAAIPFRAYLWPTQGRSHLQLWVGGAVCGEVDWNEYGISGLVICSQLTLDASLTRVVTDERWQAVSRWLMECLCTVLADLSETRWLESWFSPARILTWLKFPALRERLAGRAVFPLLDGSLASWNDLAGRSWCYVDRPLERPGGQEWASSCLLDVDHQWVAGLGELGIRLCNGDTRLAALERLPEVLRLRRTLPGKGWLEEGLLDLGVESSSEDLLAPFRQVSESALRQPETNRRLLLAYLDGCCQQPFPALEMAADCPLARLTLARWKQNPVSLVQFGQMLMRHHWLSPHGKDRFASPEGDFSLPPEMAELLHSRLGVDYLGPWQDFHNPLAAMDFALMEPEAVDPELEITEEGLSARFRGGRLQISRREIDCWCLLAEGPLAVSDGLWNYGFRLPDAEKTRLTALPARRRSRFCL